MDNEPKAETEVGDMEPPGVMDTCSVCERPLTVEGHGGKFIGVVITVECQEEEHRAAFEKAIHPYSVCFPCWLKSLGVKP